MPPWLALYNAQRAFFIFLDPTTGSDTFERRNVAGTGWEVVTNLVKGARGDVGPQARFSVYAYVNSAVAPTAVPTGGTFVRSTGTLTVPVGYTAIPETPVLTERTYRTEAVVNPANDADTVTLVWVLPSEAPEYDAAGIAEEAADRAEAAQALAEQAAGQAVDIPTGSPARRAGRYISDAADRGHGHQLGDRIWRG